MFWLPQATGSRTIPRVNDIKTTVLEVCNIARRELGSSHLGYGRDLRIRVADRSAERTAVSGNCRKNSRCVALESEDAARQILGKHSFCRCQQPLSALALPESRRKAYYLMSIHEHLPPQARRELKDVGWTKGIELAKVARRDGQDFDCATWLHEARKLPKEDCRREVEKELTGKETERSELSTSRSISSRSEKPRVARQATAPVGTTVSSR